MRGGVTLCATKDIGNRVTNNKGELVVRNPVALLVSSVVVRFQGVCRGSAFYFSSHMLDCRKVARLISWLVILSLRRIFSR